MQDDTVFVIPMAGESSRFRKVGFARPKFMLPAFGKTVFDFAIGSFTRYFKTNPFVFITNNSPEAVDFVKATVADLGIATPHFMQMPRQTDGQAETVARGLEACGLTGNNPIAIFNIDSFRPNFGAPQSPEIAAADGYLEVFTGAGNHWSFARTDGGTKVVETAEKQRISDYCSNGFYYFRRAGDFMAAYASARAEGQSGEYFIAPLYNRLIADGLDIRLHLIPERATEFCGLPTEYRDFLLSGAARAGDAGCAGQNPSLAAFQATSAAHDHTTAIAILRALGLGKPLAPAHLAAATAFLQEIGRDADAGAMQTMADFARQEAPK